jgi:membrane-bound lytic murein transglycosylase B
MIKKSTITVTLLAALTFSTPALALSCSNTSGNFSKWVGEFKKEAAGKGISKRTLDRAFAKASNVASSYLLISSCKNVAHQLSFLAAKS